MRDAGVKRFIFSSTCAVYGEPATVPIVETLDKQPINAYGETKLTIERALPHLERALRAQVDRAALLQRRRRASRRLDRRGSRRRDSPDSAGDSRRERRHAAARCSARTTRRRTAPACATTSTSATWPTPTSARSRRSSAARRPGAYNIGTGTPHSVKSVIDTVGPGRGPAGGLAIGAAPAGRSCGTLCSQRPRAARAGLAAAIRRSGGHRPARVAVAFDPSAGLCRMSHTDH